MRKNILKGMILYPSDTPRRDNAFSWFIKSFSDIGIDVEIAFFEDFTHLQPSLVRNINNSNLDFVLMRGYDYEISEWLEDKGVWVLNSTKSMRDTRDKLKTYEALTKVGLPSPKTTSIRRQSTYNDLASYFGSDTFVIKEIEGSKGEGVFLVNSEKEMASVLSNRSQTLAQEYIQSSFGKDIRVWVVGDKVVGNILRYNENSFKSNYAQGGSFRSFPLSKEASELAINATKALQLDISGVDLLFTKDGFTICEVNGNAGFRTASASTNIPDEIAAYIKERKNKT